MHAADQTVEIKTDEGEALVVSISDTTKLYQSGKHFTIDQMAEGKYVVVHGSTSPEGKINASRVVMYADKSKVLKPHTKIIL